MLHSTASFDLGPGAIRPVVAQRLNGLSCPGPQSKSSPGAATRMNSHRNAGRHTRDQQNMPRTPRLWS